MKRSQSARLRRFGALVSDFNFAEVVAFIRERVEARHVRSLLLAAKELLEEAPLFEELLLARDAHATLSLEAVESREDFEDLLERARAVVLARPHPVAPSGPASRFTRGVGGCAAAWPGQMTSERARVTATDGGDA